MNSCRFARQSGDHGPGVRGGIVDRSRKALVVVGSEEGLEASRLGVLGDGQLLGIGQALLRLDHERKAHRFLPLLPIFPVDKMVRLDSIVRMSRTISPTERSALVDAIVGQFRASV